MAVTEDGKEASSPPQAKKKPQGWKAMPYILGNETFERLATNGLVANFMVYLVRVFHFNQVSAANILNVLGGVINFAPLVGGIISDAYAGRFKTIAFASFAGLLGMLTVTLTAWLPELHPAKCNLASQYCKGPNKSQLGVLLTGLGLLAIATGGIRPCSIPFGIDQFDATTEKGVKGIKSFYNWYYMSFTVVLILAQTAIVYIQDSVGWVLGFGIPTLLMLSAIILFFTGTKIYILVEPQGSVFSGIAQVFVAAFKKRRLKLPEDRNVWLFYDPPSNATTILKLPLTNQFRFLNKAAVILDNELKPEGTPINHWRLCSIQQVEEVKCLLKIVPIWTSGIVSFITLAQQSTFTVSQAMKMDRHLGPEFQIPPGSMAAISMLTVAIWLPIYDQIAVPALRKITNEEGGITVLQRMGIGIVFSFLSMLVAGLVEIKRRTSANSHPHLLGIAPISVMWLAPVFILIGLCESFNVLGMIELYNKEFPDNMKGVANSLVSISCAIAFYLSSFIINVIHETSGKRGRSDWLTNDINAGRLDYFYFLIAGIGVLNLVYFLYCANRFTYKDSVRAEVQPCHDLELSSSTSS